MLQETNLESKSPQIRDKDLVKPKTLLQILQTINRMRIDSSVEHISREF